MFSLINAFNYLRTIQSKQCCIDIIVMLTVLYIVSKNFISNFKNDTLASFDFIYICICNNIFIFKSGVGTDYDFLSQNLIIESLKYSMFEYGENKNLKNLFMKATTKIFLVQIMKITYQ